MPKFIIKLMIKVKRWHLRFRQWLNNRRLAKAIKLLRPFGLVPVRIMRKANTDYLVAMDGTHYRIGGKEKKK